MADIKKFSKNIKKFDNARYGAEKINTAMMQSKRRINKSISAQENTPEEYATERVNEKIERVAEDSAYLANRAGKQATETTIENYKKYKTNKQTKENIKNIKKSGKAIKEGAKKTVVAIIEGGKALVSAIIAGGWVSAVIIILICLVAPSELLFTEYSFHRKIVATE